MLKVVTFIIAIVFLVVIFIISSLAFFFCGAVFGEKRLSRNGNRLVLGFIIPFSLWLAVFAAVLDHWSTLTASAILWLCWLLGVNWRVSAVRKQKKTITAN